jgi:hypothetical protein
MWSCTMALNGLIQKRCSYRLGTHIWLVMN